MGKNGTKIKWMAVLAGVSIMLLSIFTPPGTPAYGELPVSEHENWVWGGLAFLLIWYGIWGHRLRYHAKKGLKICPSCQKQYPEASKALCPSCNASLEPLNGFYERHPELKD